jgi:hypothetical protein
MPPIDNRFSPPYGSSSEGEVEVESSFLSRRRREEARRSVFGRVLGLQLQTNQVSYIVGIFYLFI